MLFVCFFFLRIRPPPLFTLTDPPFPDTPRFRSRRAFLQVRGRGLRHEEHAEDVGLEGAAKLVFGDVANVLVGMLLPGVVDEHVDPAETVDDLADRLFAERRVAEIACDGDGIPPFVPADSGEIGRASCRVRVWQYV